MTQKGAVVSESDVRTEGASWPVESWQTFIEGRAKKLEQVYSLSPERLVSDRGRELSTTGDYHGRELLELLQNADDEAPSGDDARVVVELSREGLCVANVGRPFTCGGLESLMMADNSPKQYDRARYIGNKGLGFRSVLGWTRRPWISSGNMVVVFDTDRARGWLTEVCARHPHISALVDAQAKQGVAAPIALLARPFSGIGSGGAARDVLPLQDATTRLRADGFDTVIALPFTEPKAFEQAREQLARIGREVLIFTRHVRSLVVRHPAGSESWRVKRSDDMIELHRQGFPAERWSVRTTRGTVPEHALKPDQQRTPEYEIRVGLPESAGVQLRQVLFSYFPTDVRLPLPVVLHATMELTTNRQHLVKSAVNEFLVPKLAEALVDAALQETTSASAFSPLERVAPAGDVDPMLERMEFGTALVAAVKARQMVPLRDGRLVLASKALLVAPERLDWLPDDAFGDVVQWPAKPAVEKLMLALGIPQMPPTELKRRLSVLPRTFSLQRRAKLIAGLVSSPRFHEALCTELLIDTAGEPIPGGVSVFLPPAEASSLVLPTWLSVRLIDRTLVEQLRVELKLSSAQELASRLKPMGVREYSLADVVASLNAETRRQSHAAPTQAFPLHRDLIAALQRIHSSFGKHLPMWPADVSIQLPTKAGELARADSLYFGDGYLRGALASALYPGQPKRFVQDPTSLGLSCDADAAFSFLSWIGVAALPRTVDRPPGDPDRFMKHVAKSLRYPASFGLCEPGDVQVGSADEFSNARIEHLSSVDGLDEILSHASAGAIIAWLATDGRFDEWREIGDPTATVHLHRKREGRQLHGQPFPSYVCHRVETRPWLPSTAGGNVAPKQAFLRPLASVELTRVLPSPAVSLTDPLLRRLGLDTYSLHRAHGRAGVQPSIDEMPWDAIYDLLLQWPVFDPNGRAARALYGELIERKDLPAPSPSQARFLESGRVWGNRGGSGAYFPIRGIQYDDGALPAVLRRSLALLDLSPKRGARLVKQILGVSTVRAADLHVTVVEHTPSPRAIEFANAFETLKPWLLVYHRCHRTNDPPLSILKTVHVVLCGRARARAGARESPIDVQLGSGDVLLTRDAAKVWVVADESDSPSLAADPVITDMMGLAASQILGVEQASDFARLAGCEASGRVRFLAHLVSKARPEVEQLLKKASADLLVATAEESDASAPTVVSGAAGPAIPPSPPTSNNPPANAPAAPPPPPPAPVPSPVSPVGAVTAKTTAPPQPSPQRTVSLRVRATPRTGGGTGAPRGTAVDPVRSQEVAARFEEHQNRFPLAVDYLQGAQAYGCDLLSFKTDADRQRCAKAFDAALVERFIEVKGKAAGGAVVHLEGNELKAALDRTASFYLYRVFEWAPGEFDLLELANPTTGVVKVIHEVDMARSAALVRWEVKELSNQTAPSAAGEPGRAE